MTKGIDEAIDARAREILGSVVGQKIDDSLFTNLRAEFERSGFRGVSVSADVTSGNVEVSGATPLGIAFWANLSGSSVSVEQAPF